MKGHALLIPGGRLACEFRHAYSTGKSATNRNLVHVQEKSFFTASLFYDELIMQLKATSVVFEYLGLNKPTQSSRIRG